MATVYSVAITSGVPSSGTGEVATINAFISAAGTPSSQAATVQNSSLAFTVSIASAPGGNIATIKAANTAASSADLALVVALSPNNINANGQTTMANSAPVTIASDQTAVDVNLVPQTSGGYTVSTIILSTTTNATLISSVACQLYHIEGFNVSSLPAYVKLYNLSSTPTAGTTTNIGLRYVIPNNTAGAGAISEYVNGVPFATGLGYCVTSSMNSSDTTVLQTGASVILTVMYK